MNQASRNKTGSTNGWHRTLKAETTRPPATNLEQQQKLFNRFRRDYNQIRPHEGIDLQIPGSLYLPSPPPLPKAVPPLIYPAHFETRLVSKNSGIRWNNQKVAVSTAVAGLYLGLEQVDYARWDVYLGPIKLGCLLEDWLRIEDHLGRLKRIHL